MISVILLLTIASQTSTVASVVMLFLKYTTHKSIHMLDIFFILASISFFGLMLAFMAACNKV